MKKAFSLVELIVVIAIIGMLAAVIMGTFTGGTDAARGAQCMANMRNLGSACQSAGVALGHYPPAGSFETVTLSRSGSKVEKQFDEVKGWISWNSQGAYAPKSGTGNTKPKSHQASKEWNLSAYEQDEESRLYAITNGVLWKFVGGTHATYICPLHAKTMTLQKPNWSYVMNAYFKWDYSRGSSSAVSTSPGYRYYGQLKKADRRLLFAELPFVKAKNINIDVPEGSDETTDCVLQYEGCYNCGTPECIGFNHKSGKKYYANVCFADGHTEKLMTSKNGINRNDAVDLTKWLCEGEDVSFNGTRYEKISK